MLKKLLMAIAIAFCTATNTNAQGGFGEFLRGFAKGVSEGIKKNNASTNNNTSTSNTLSNNRSTQSNSSNQKVWREELSMGMFSINEGNPNGARTSTTYGFCNACRGSVRCGNCRGMKSCTLCNGKGGMTGAYNSFIPCTMCGQTGLCPLCHGTGKCVCSQGKYPGYRAMSTTMIGPDGSIITEKFYDEKESSSSSSSSRSSKTRPSTRGTCSKCGGRGFDLEPYKYAPASISGWKQPYHNYTGYNCPYCSYKTDHYHHPCARCFGHGHN